MFTAHPTFSLSVDRERPRGRADEPRRHAATAAQRRSARAAPHRAARNAADAARRSRGRDCGAAHPAPSRAAHGARGRRRCRGTLSARAASACGRDSSRSPRGSGSISTAAPTSVGAAASRAVTSSRWRGLAELDSAIGAVRERHAAEAEASGTAFADLARSLAALDEAFRAGLEALNREAEDSIRLGRLNRIALDGIARKQDALHAIDSAFDELLGETASDAFCRDVLVLRSEWETFGLGTRTAALPPELRATAQRHPARHRTERRARAKPVPAAVPARGDRPARRRRPGQRALRHRGARADHRETRVHARGAVLQALRRPHADSPADRRVGHSLHAARRALLCAALRRRAPHRDLAAVRDGGRPASRRPRHRASCSPIRTSSPTSRCTGGSASSSGSRTRAATSASPPQRSRSSGSSCGYSSSGRRAGSAPRSSSSSTLTASPSAAARIRAASPTASCIRIRARSGGGLGELPAPYKHEVSFQGGEGYLWFASERTAFAVAVDLLQHAARARDGRAARRALHAQRVGRSTSFSR